MATDIPRSLAPHQDQWVRNELGIYLPKSYAEKTRQERLPRMFDFTVLTVEYSALTGHKPTMEDALTRLKRYSLQWIVSVIARITLTLSLADDKAGIIDPAIQDRLLANLLGSNAMNRLWEALLKRNPDHKREKTVWFNERQTLNTLKLAFLTIDHDAPQPPLPTRDPFLPFVEALLMVSELMDDERARTKEADAPDDDKLELYAYANVLFNAEGDPVRETVRSHYFYLESHPEITSKAGLVDLPLVLGEVTGLTAARTWAALFALYGAFRILSHDDVDAGRVTVSRTDYFRNMSKLSPEEAALWFSLAMLSVSDMQEEVRARYTLEDPNWFDLLTFEMHPLVSFGDKVFCLSMLLLHRLENSSLWYRLLQPAVPERTRLAVLDTRGRLIERYVGQILRRMFGDRYFDEEALNRCVNPERKKKRVCDGLIAIGDAAVLVEIKETSIALPARQASSLAVYKEKRRKLVEAAATQIASTADHLRESKFESLGIDTNAIKHIIPLIVSMDQPANPTLYRSIREHDLAATPLGEAMRRGKVEPVQLTNVADLELLEIAAEAGADVMQLLLAKGRSADEVGLAFNQYLHGRVDYERAPKHGSWYGERWDQLMDALTLELREAGLPASDDLEKIAESN